jgi:hypothetical protein
MKKTVWSIQKETLNIIMIGLKKNLITYFVLLFISLVAIATVILAPFGIKFLIGMHEMLIAEGTIDYKKLFAKVDDDKNYFKTLLVLLAELVIIAGGTALLVVPGVVLALGLIPVNYLLYKGTAPKMSVIIPSSFETMKGKKTNAFLSLLIFSVGYAVVSAILLISSFFLGRIYFLLAWPLTIVWFAVTLIAAMYLLTLLVLIARQATTVAEEQPAVTA